MRLVLGLEQDAMLLKEYLVFSDVKRVEVDDPISSFADVSVCSLLEFTYHLDWQLDREVASLCPQFDHVLLPRCSSDWSGHGPEG